MNTTMGDCRVELLSLRIGPGQVASQASVGRAFPGRSAGGSSPAPRDPGDEAGQGVAADQLSKVGRVFFPETVRDAHGAQGLGDVPL